MGIWTTPFVPGAAFSPDGQLLALAAADGIVRVWELATRKQVAAAAMGWANTLAFAPHGGLLAGMTWDGDVVVARAPASVALRTGFHPNGCTASFAPVLSPDGRRVVAPAAGGAGVWNVDGERLQLLRTPARPVRSPERCVATAAFSGDGQSVAASANSRLLRAGRAPSGSGRPSRAPAAARRSLASRSLSASNSTRAARSSPPPDGVADGDRRRVRSLDGIVGLSPDGRLALTRRHGTPRSCGSAREQPSQRSVGPWDPRSPAVSATFSPDGRRIVTLRATPCVSGTPRAASRSDGSVASARSSTATRSAGTAGSCS